MDENRAFDGMDLRHRFAEEYTYLSGPPNVLEVLIALSIRMEGIARGTIDLSKAGQWFWGMIKSLNIFDCYDGEFDEDKVEYFVNEWLDGQSGIGIFPECEGELWTQAMDFLSEIFV